MKKRQTLYCDRRINNLNRLHIYYDEKVDKESLYENLCQYIHFTIDQIKLITHRHFSIHVFYPLVNTINMY